MLRSGGARRTGWKTISRQNQVIASQFFLNSYWTKDCFRKGPHSCVGLNWCYNKGSLLNVVSGSPRYNLLDLFQIILRRNLYGRMSHCTHWISLGRGIVAWKSVWRKGDEKFDEGKQVTWYIRQRGQILVGQRSMELWKWRHELELKSRTLEGVPHGMLLNCWELKSAAACLIAKLHKLQIPVSKLHLEF